MTCERPTPSSRLPGLRNTYARLTLDRFAQANYGRRVIHLALRWVLDRQDSMIALWGARRPDQLSPIGGLAGWHIDSSAMAEIDRILAETIIDPVGPEFMAPPVQLAA